MAYKHIIEIQASVKPRVTSMGGGVPLRLPFLAGACLRSVKSGIIATLWANWLAKDFTYIRSRRTIGHLRRCECCDTLASECCMFFSVQDVAMTKNYSSPPPPLQQHSSDSDVEPSRIAHSAVFFTGNKI